MDTKLFLKEYVEPVFEYEKFKLSADLSPIQKEMQTWESPWREESLEHYASMGWSFVSFSRNQIVGYVIGQPLLFFNNWTQSLWIEHLSFDTEEVGYELMDVSIRWAKTKHLQKVLVNNKIGSFEKIKSKLKTFSDAGYYHLSTTKISED